MGQTSYKIGDRVRIKPYKRLDGEPGFNSNMKEWCGKVMTIRRFANNYACYMVEDMESTRVNSYPGWVWNMSWFEPEPQTRMCVNPTILCNFI